MASENLPFRNMSVLQFCDQAKHLLKADLQAEFVQFVLTGQHGGTQIVIDPILDSICEQENFGVLRDYDSVLGIDEQIRILGSLTVYPVAKKEDTLSTSVHLRHTFTRSTGNLTVPLHKVPNLCIGKWATHNIIRVFIPELYNDQRSPFLSQEEQKIFYEQGLQPAIEQLDSEHSAEWPATYSDEMFRARGRNGQLSFQTKVVPDWFVKFLGDLIRSSLEENGYSWGNGLVFLHQIRGVKHSSSHSVDYKSAADALDTFLRQNQLDTSQGHWWIDVGLEVCSEQQRCLAWRTDSHTHLLQNVTRISEHHAIRLTRPGSSQYTRDMVSHLPSVSGCRISPGVQARGPHATHYFQAYTTDKLLTYRVDQGHYGKYITCADILKGKAPDYIQKLYQLYNNAIDTNYSLARVEVRVPLSNASQVLLDLNENILRDSLLSFSGSVWWSLRSYRALALQFILEWQIEGDPVHRATMPALLLTAGSAWLLNGLHSAPDKGASSKDLMAAILPHIRRDGSNPDILAYGSPSDDNDVISDESTDSEDDEIVPPPRRQCRDAVTLPAFPYGLVFFRRIRVGHRYPVPRFNDDGQSICTKSFRYFFGVEFSQISTEFFRVGLVHPAHPSRVRNKVQRTTVYIDWDALEGRSERTQKDFNLIESGYQLPSPTRDAGSDISTHGEEDSDAESDIDDKLTQLWRQFLLDITSKAPNNKRAGEPSHCILTKEQRNRVNEATYKNDRLSNYFRDCQWRVADTKEWNVIFSRLFPPKGSPPLAGHIQNYKSMEYYPKWDNMKKVDDNTYFCIYNALEAKFNKLYWMPFAQADRVWYTKFDGRFNKPSGFSRNLPAPLVLVNGFSPRW